MKYSVADLMSMRESIEGMFPYGVSYKPEQRSADIERQLVTYMNNGTTAEELQKAAEGHRQRYFEMRHAIMNSMNPREEPK